MEYLLQYEYTITYIKGEQNSVADMLSCMPMRDDVPLEISVVFSIQNNPKLFANI
jgi:hypothetical protein